MKEILRFFSLGVINLLGIIFPGLMFIMLLVVTVVWPGATLLHKVIHIGPGSEILLGWTTLNEFPKGNSTLIIIVGFMLSYVLGYIIRLTTVDKLDKISAKKVIKQMGKDYKKNCPSAIAGIEDPEAAAIREECWPYHGGPSDKFPYLHLKSYLEKRGLTDISELVTWSSLPSPKDGEGFLRSKKIINNYKIEIFYKSPQLSTIIESNEAHIRLTYGTWRVSKLFFWVALAALAVLLLALGLFRLPLLQFSLIIFVELILAALLFYSKRKIEFQFHYQRIKELVQILVCTKLARESHEKSNPNET